LGWRHNFHHHKYHHFNNDVHDNDGNFYNASSNSDNHLEHYDNIGIFNYNEHHSRPNNFRSLLP
jgi:hypothetical protein